MTITKQKDGFTAITNDDGALIEVFTLADDEFKDTIQTSNLKLLCYSSQADEMQEKMNASERHAVVSRVSRKDAHSLEVEFTVPGGFRTYPYAYVAIIDEAGTKSGTEKLVTAGSFYSEIQPESDPGMPSFTLTLKELVVSDGVMTVPFSLQGFSLTDQAKADSFTIEGLNVSDFQKTGGHTGLLMIQAESSADKNSAAAALNRKTITIQGNVVGRDEAVSFEIDAAPPSFYPVFDYSEDRDDSYQIILKLYARGGTFAEELNTEMICLSDDFSGGTIESIVRENDAMAELTLNIPSEQSRSGDMELSGTVTLTAGALIGRFGEPACGETFYTRTYNQESMGKDPLSTALLSAEDISAAVDSVVNTPLSTFMSGASGVIAAGQAVYTILELTGVVESEMSILNDIRNMVAEIQETLVVMEAKLDAVITEQYRSRIMLFSDKLNGLQAACGMMDAKMKKIRREQPRTGAKSDTDYAAAIYKTFWDSQENIMILHTLTKSYSAVCSSLSGASLVMASPLADYDKVCEFIYNFDTSTYRDRELFRANIRYLLDLAGQYILACYAVREDWESMELYSRYYDEAVASMKKLPVIHRTDQRARLLFCDQIFKTDCLWFSQKGYVPSFVLYFDISKFTQNMHGRTISDELLLAGFHIDSEEVSRRKWFLIRSLGLFGSYYAIPNGVSSDLIHSETALPYKEGCFSIVQIR